MMWLVEGSITKCLQRETRCATRELDFMAAMRFSPYMIETSTREGAGSRYAHSSLLLPRLDILHSYPTLVFSTPFPTPRKQ